MKIVIPVVTAVLLASTAALAQTTSPSPSAPSPTSPSPTTPAERSPSTSVAPSTSTTPAKPSVSSSATDKTMSEAQAKALIDKAVYSSDNKNVGDVAAIKRDASGKVTELHADVGGFLGIGTTRVRVMPSEFNVQGDRIMLTLTSDQVKSLPKVDKSESTGNGGTGSSTTPGSTGPSGTSKTK